MPKFPKSDGFSLGGNPFTMTKGSKEINTEGSFRKEATGKMGSYGSPLFAIGGRDPSSAGAAYKDTTTDMGADVDAAFSEGKAATKAMTPEETTPVEDSAEALGNKEMNDAKKSVIGDVKESTLETPEVDMGDDEEIEL